jgi:hypothetical protein
MWSPPLTKVANNDDQAAVQSLPKTQIKIRYIVVSVIAFSQKRVLVVFANTRFSGFVEIQFSLSPF